MLSLNCLLFGRQNWPVKCLDFIRKMFCEHSLSFMKNPNRIEDGYFVTSEAPGIGVELDEVAIKKYPFEQQGFPPPIRPDGSIGLR